MMSKSACVLFSLMAFDTPRRFSSSPRRVYRRRRWIIWFTSLSAASNSS